MLPPVEERVHADFGPAIWLYGYDLDSVGRASNDRGEGAEAVLIPGERLQLNLHWLAKRAPQDDYFVFVHLVDEADQIVAQQDRVPVDGLRPTGGWRWGEVLVDRYRLMLPETLPAGRYRLYVGLYHHESGARLPVAAGGTHHADGRLLLHTFTVR